MERRCVITGLGMIAAVGNSADACFEAVKLGKTGIETVASVSTEGCYTHLGAEVRGTELPAPDCDRSVRLCIRAAEEALSDAHLQGEDRAHAGLIVGSCVAGVDSLDRYYTEGKQDPSLIPRLFASSLANNTAAYLGLSGVTANIVNACAAGTMSLAYACDLIRSGEGEIFLAGGTDAFSSLAFAGFHALHALSEGPCSPFNHSNGITLGEGAGILVVESYESAVRRGAHILCEISGFGISSDAFHITAPHPQGEGQMLAIRRAMASAGVAPGEISYINAHGTGTAKNDEAEWLSLHTLFDGTGVSVSSTKSMTGHCLGAAGAIEAVLTVKALTEDTVPPTIFFTEEEKQTLAAKAGGLDFPANHCRARAMQTAMSNSFAFGGTNASMIFSKEAHTPKPRRHVPVCITGIGMTVAQDGQAPDLSMQAFAGRGVPLGFFRKLDRFSLLELASGKDALADAKLTITPENAPRVGSVIGTADGPIGEIDAFQQMICEKGPTAGSAFSFPNTVYNAAGGYLSINTGLKGTCATVANGESAGLQSLAYACDLLQGENEDVMLVSGTDEGSENLAELYRAMGHGEHFSEGSVTLTLETAAHAAARGAEPYAYVAGYALAHQALPYTERNPSDDTVRKAADTALDRAGIDRAALSYVFAEPAVASVLALPAVCAADRIGNARAANPMHDLAQAARALHTDPNAKYALVVATARGGCCAAVVLSAQNGKKEEP